MTTINEVTKPEGKAKELLDAIEKKNGKVINIFKLMANAPAVLEGFLGMNSALGNGKLDAKLREQLALTVAGVNQCDYCASAHTAMGTKAGLMDVDLKLSLHGDSKDAKTKAALVFAKDIVEKRGKLGKDAVEHIKKEGFSDGEVVEIIAVVCLNIFTNYFNHIAETKVDFPLVHASGSK